MAKLIGLVNWRVLALGTTETEWPWRKFNVPKIELSKFRGEFMQYTRLFKTFEAKVESS